MAHDVKEVTDSTSAVELGEKLWLDADGNVVKDGDRKAAELIGPAGYRLSREKAIAYGLVKPSAGEKKQADADAKADEEADAAADPDAASEESLGVTKEQRVTANKQRPAARNKGKK